MNAGRRTIHENYTSSQGASGCFFYTERVTRHTDSSFHSPPRIYTTETDDPSRQMIRLQYKSGHFESVYISISTLTHIRDCVTFSGKVTASPSPRKKGRRCQYAYLLFRYMMVKTGLSFKLHNSDQIVIENCVMLQQTSLLGGHSFFAMLFSCPVPASVTVRQHFPPSPPYHPYLCHST